MYTKSFGLWRGLVVAVAIGALASPFASGQQQRRRDRPPGLPREQEQAREGHARQRLKAPDKQEGTEEGMPEGKLVVPQDPAARQRFLQSRWRLGVFAYNSDTGVIITRVVPGTPAWKEGLEPGDVIVTVGGYQVGIVNNLVYSLGQELQLRADRNGRVPLLVQNHRDGELLMLDVGLQRFGVIWPQ